MHKQIHLAAALSKFPSYGESFERLCRSLCSKCRWQSGCYVCDAQKALRYYFKANPSGSDRTEKGLNHLKLLRLHFPPARKPSIALRGQNLSLTLSGSDRTEKGNCSINRLRLLSLQFPPARRPSEALRGQHLSLELLFF